MEAHPRVDQWSNGTDATAELKRMMAIRKTALSRFGEQSIKRNEPMATIEEVLVPLYLHHRYQVEAAASTVEGFYFVYAVRGDGTRTREVRSGGRTARGARGAPHHARTVRARVASRAARQDSAQTGWLWQHARALPALHRPDVRRDHTRRRRLRSDGRYLLDHPRAARLVEQHALDPTLPGLDTVIDELVTSTFAANARTWTRPRSRAPCNARAIERLMTLASTADMPQVRAIASQKLQQRAQRLTTTAQTAGGGSAHAALLASDIKRFLDWPFAPATRADIPTAPPGAPICDPGMDWLGRLAPFCSWEW